VRITRRHLLATAAAVPVVGALASAGLAWRWWDRPPGQGLKRLSADEHAFVQAVAEAWMPAGGDPPLSGADARLGDFVDDVVAGMTPGGARDFKLLLQVLDDLPVVTHLAPFRSLSLEARADVLEGWLHRSTWLVRNAAAGVLVLVGEGWAMHPDVIGILRPSFRCGYGP
jgi:hypothetical protein